MKSNVAKKRIPVQNLCHLFSGIPALSNCAFLGLLLRVDLLANIDELILGRAEDWEVLCCERHVRELELDHRLPSVMGILAAIRISHKVEVEDINDLLEIRSVSVLKLHFSKVDANSSLLPVRHMSCNHFGTKSFPPFFSSHCRLSLAFNAFLRLKASLGAALASPPASGLASA